MLIKIKKSINELYYAFDKDGSKIFKVFIISFLISTILGGCIIILLAFLYVITNIDSLIYFLIFAMLNLIVYWCIDK